MTTPAGKLPLRQRARKAFAAAGVAFVGAVALALGTEVPRTREGWFALVGAAAGVALAAGVATFRARNAGTGPNGSEPVTPPGVYGSPR